MPRPALTDRQLDRMVWRIGLFQRRGLSESAAEALADRLADRDHERDDRRCCLECSERTADRGCRVVQRDEAKPWPQRVLKAAAYRFTTDDTTLVRCPGFAWETP